MISTTAAELNSTRPYLVRAIYEWCTDNGFTPYVAVDVDESVQVPREYVKDGEIVLNISFDATSSLQLGNEFIEFKARFAGVSRSIMVPIDRVLAIYALENGQGMAFPRSATVRSSAVPVAGLTRAGQKSDSKTLQLVESDSGSARAAPVVQSDTTTAGSTPVLPGARTKGKPSLTRIK